MGALSQDPMLDLTAERPRKWPLRRVTGLIVGLVLVVCSLGSIAAGGFAATARYGGTYVDLGAHGTYRTDQYGLVTDSTNWRTTWFGWADAVRLRVASAGQTPIFAGVAAPDEISRYLAGVGYTTVGEDSRADHVGGAPAIPAQAVDWTAHAEGTGTQTLRWNATDGRQVAFAMNADGSRPVNVRVVSSAITLERMPWWVPAGALAFGVILLPIGAVMTRRAIRGRRAVA